MSRGTSERKAITKDIGERDVPVGIEIILKNQPARNSVKNRMFPF
jgi:hypothetical protein